MTPPCTYPIGPQRDRCGRSALYGFRLVDWPERQRAAVCPAHAIVTRNRGDVATMWSIRPWRAPAPSSRARKVRP